MYASYISLLLDINNNHENSVHEKEHNKLLRALIEQTEFIDLVNILLADDVSRRKHFSIQFNLFRSMKNIGIATRARRSKKNRNFNARFVSN